MKIHKIKYSQKFKFCIDSNSKTSRFAKLSTSECGSIFQFAKLSFHEMQVFYSNRWSDGPEPVNFALGQYELQVTGLVDQLFIYFFFFF